MQAHVQLFLLNVNAGGIDSWWPGRPAESTTV